ncbi:MULTISPECIES: DUF7511 domain-containing protein [Halorussus]|uniref:DUF7511 domain-containing protein n=1 Tax=Halorussus TaxID=1070314 RepID=UPI00209E2471|nr:hypothetical protein [Halorussus vallis]USZ76777.1 hypothetical protein NGM07_05480 [Halorussus vallis]
MSSNPDTADGRTDPDHPAPFDTELNADHPLAELRSVVVNYEDRPDRRTVYPEGLPTVERMSTWLTADDDAFVDLDEAR